MNEQTIYSYKLLYRFRWRFLGYLFQLLLLLGILAAVSVASHIKFAKMVVSLSIIVAIPFIHHLLFRLYAYLRRHSVKLSPDMLFSAWWGSGTPVPLRLSVYRELELTVVAGSVLVGSALYPWLPSPYGITLLTACLTAALPRLLGVIISLRQPSSCSVKYETKSIAFLKTDG
ncbi:hypothetical protein [Brevibacillus fulvus]|uniref:Uncharacterized protein n=1 Tax=Brevibacillus fulvus TaxID=1125967 RepID=A0A938Y5T5_9BACL|nr:hypothetical protein [Brevibacillus fulvus]MBM7592077.1 hypothetical protein [Brevibacillus fulvus]